MIRECSANNAATTGTNIQVRGDEIPICDVGNKTYFPVCSGNWSRGFQTKRSS
jgi:hypothetical protein